jgi:hypothetical protein
VNPTGLCGGSEKPGGEIVTGTVGGLTEPGTVVVVEPSGEGATVVFVVPLFPVVAPTFLAAAAVVVGVVVTTLLVVAAALLVVAAAPGVVATAGVVVVGVAPTPAVVVLVVTAQFAAFTVSESSVTAPLRASTRPLMVAPLVTVMLVRAMTVPTKLEPVPRVAELATCQ